MQRTHRHEVVRPGEAALAYHFIRKAEVAPTATEVAGRVETWLAENFAVNVDFKIADALDTLDRFGIVRREGDRLFVPSLEAAITQFHQVWNNFFKRDERRPDQVGSRNS